MCRASGGRRGHKSAGKGTEVYHRPRETRSEPHGHTAHGHRGMPGLLRGISGTRWPLLRVRGALPDLILMAAQRTLGPPEPPEPATTRLKPDDDAEVTTVYALPGVRLTATLPPSHPLLYHCARCRGTVHPLPPQRSPLSASPRRRPLLSHARCRASLCTPPPLLRAEESARGTDRKLRGRLLSCSRRLRFGDSRRGDGDSGALACRSASELWTTKPRWSARCSVQDRRRRGRKSGSLQVRRHRLVAFPVRPSTPSSDPQSSSSNRLITAQIFGS
jgi:hypothetical protein